MNQTEMEEFWRWCFEHTTIEQRGCDESDHFYLNGHYVGGWAGDCRQYFTVGTHCASDEDVQVMAKLVKMYNTWKNFDDPEWVV